MFAWDKTLSMSALAILISVFISCGDGTTPQEMDPQATASVEPKSVEKGKLKEFYPFDEPPMLEWYETPDHPSKARSSSLEGFVAVKVLVDVDGTVEQATALDISDPIFETAALEAASKCRFEPAKLKGQVTKSFVMIPFHFKLER